MMTRKPRILVVGSFVMDVIATTERVPGSSQTVYGKSFHMAPGGKGANQALQCARLGADVTMMGCVGDDLFGRSLLESPRAAGVDVSHVLVRDGVTSGVGHVTLEVTDHSAQNRIIVTPGANRTLTVEEAAWIKDEIHTYDMVLLQLEVPLAVNRAVARWAKEADVPVMLNPAPATDLDDELLSLVTYLTPNEQEAAVETGLPLRMDGTVTSIFMMPTYHNVIIVRHGGYLTVYAGLTNISVSKGQKVKAGQTLGTIWTNPDAGNRTELHFEVRHERTKLNPLEWVR